VPERTDGKDVQEDKPKTKPKEKLPTKPEKKEKSAFINKYGFLHIDKTLAKYLGLKFGEA